MTQSTIIRSSQDLGVLIAQARRERGLSQRQLAAELGVTQAWLSRVERGQQKAWIGQVLRLAVHLGIEITGRQGSDAVQEVRKSASDGYPDLNKLF